MFGVDDVFLATLAAQIGSAIFNSIRGNKHSKELAAKQQAYEEKVTRGGIQNAREEFAALCSLQREIESEMQRDRIDMIKANHANAILEKAYSVALDKWPLLVPPYVVKNECLLNIEQGQRDVLPLNCIMTTSMDSNFNKSIFPNVEEAIAEFCYTYWNVASERCIRFYQRAWKDNITDIGAECRNFHALMKDVPTLVLSPQVRHGKLTFRFFWWGLSTNPQDVHIEDNCVFDPELSNPVYEGMKYSDDDIRIILSELVPRIEAFISYFADLYYWNYTKTTPLLPALMQNCLIKLQKEDGNNLISAYKAIISNVLKDDISNNTLINLYGHKLIELMRFLPYASQKEEICLKKLRKKFFSIKGIDCLSLGNILKSDVFSQNDIPLLNSLKALFNDKEQEIDELINRLKATKTLALRDMDKTIKYQRACHISKDRGIESTYTRTGKYNF